MRDKVVVGVHADDSSDDESSSQVSSYALGAQFVNDEDGLKWSRFNFLLGVRCLYAANTSQTYYRQKTELGVATWPEAKLKAWIKAAVMAIIDAMLYHSAYPRESKKLVDNFVANHANKIAEAEKALAENPRTLAKQLRNDRKLIAAIQENLEPLRQKLKEFVTGIQEVDVTAPGSQPLSFDDIRDVEEFHRVIMQQASQFLLSEGLMRADGRVALAKYRSRHLVRLETRTDLKLWQKKCVFLAKPFANANINLRDKLSNHSSEIITAWLRDAFVSIQPRGVAATANPEVFLIPVGFDFSQEPFADLFAEKPLIFTRLFAKAGIFQTSSNQKLGRNFASLSAEIFHSSYQQQGLKLQRPAFKSEFKLEGVVSWLASLRLAIRLKRRAQRSALEIGDGERVHEKHTAVTWHLLCDDPNRDYAVVEQQTLTSLASQADLLPDLGSYKAISEDLAKHLAAFNRAHSNFKLVDKNLAIFIIRLLQTNKFAVFTRGPRRLDLASCDDFSAIALKKFIVALTCLLFVIEVQRHPAALVMHILMLDLIKDGKMTFAEAFEGEMPMAMEGAVAVARHIQVEHRDASFHPYSYPGAPKSSAEFAAKESALVGKWLGVFAPNVTNNREKMTAVCERVQGFCGA